MTKGMRAGVLALALLFVSGAALAQSAATLDQNHYITGTVCEKPPAPVAGEPSVAPFCVLLNLNVGTVADCVTVADAWSTTPYFTQALQQVPRFRGGTARLKCYYSPIVIEIPDSAPDAGGG